MERVNMKQAKKMESIQFILTHRCNLSCTYCLRRSGHDRSEMSFDMIKEIVEKAEFNGSKRCVLTGGEAALHSRFWDIINLLAEHRFTIFIESNGFAMNAQWLDRLMKIVDVSHLSFLISLDHFDFRIHDKFRGEGKFEKAVEAIKLLRRSGIPVQTNCVVNRNNFFTRLEFKKMLELLCELKVNRANFSPIVSVGNNQDNGQSLTRFETELLAEMGNEFMEIYKGRIAVTGFKSEIERGCNRLDAKNLVVSYKGFHPCLYLDDVVVKDLREGIDENFNFTDSLPHLKRSVDIAEKNDTNACWSCCQSFQKFFSNPPFKA